MEIKSYRSLDRSVQFFGIKGRFLIPMGAGAALSLVAAMIAGKATNGLVGVGLFLILFFCLEEICGVSFHEVAKSCCFHVRMIYNIRTKKPPINPISSIMMAKMKSEKA